MSPVGRLAADLWTAPPKHHFDRGTRRHLAAAVHMARGAAVPAPGSVQFLGSLKCQQRSMPGEPFLGAQKCGLKKQFIPLRLENSFPKPISWVFLCTK